MITENTYNVLSY